MLKQAVSLFLLLFITQTVLAGIDLHPVSENNDSGHIASIDIVVHYIDSHELDYSKCNSDSSVSNTSIDDNASHSIHHECHGHITSISFTDISFVNNFFSHFYTRFDYTLSDYSVTLNSLKRPPIA